MIPKITVLMSVYNDKNIYIKDSIESILNQTFSDFEFLIIDDGSISQVKSVLKKYAKSDDRIRIIRKKHTGLTHSLNIGIKQARGKWIARMDADDISFPNRLLHQFNYAEKKNVALVGGGCVEINEDEKSIRKFIYPYKHDKLVDHMIKFKGKFPHSTSFFSKKVVEKLGGYNSNFSKSQDLDLWLRISEVGEISCLPKIIIKSRRHPQSISSTNFELQQTLGVCARICYFRRKWGCSDPSQGRNWQEFKMWVKSKLDEKGIFVRKQQKKKIKKVLLEKKSVRNKNFLLDLFLYPSAVFGVLFNEKRDKNIAIRLAEESKNFF